MTIFVARRRRCAAGFINRAKVLGRSPGKYTSCCRPRLVIVVAKLRRGTSTNVSSPTNAAPVVYPRLNRASTSSPLMTTFRPASARPFVAESSTTEFGDGSFVAYILEQWRNFFPLFLHLSSYQFVEIIIRWYSPFSDIELLIYIIYQGLEMAKVFWDRVDRVGY